MSNIVNNEEIISENDGLGKDKATWWTKFRDILREKEINVVVELMERMDEITDHETQENVNEIKVAISNLNVVELKEVEEQIVKEYKVRPADANIISNLNRRLRFLEKRVDRKVDESFGALIKKYRTEKSLSLKQLEVMTGISPSYINRMEKGERKAPSYPVIEKLADALGIDIGILLDVANPNDNDRKIPTLAEVLFLNDFTVNGSRVTRQEKDIIIEIMDKINGFSWNQEKHIESIQIVELINTYKNLNKNE